VLTRNSIVGAVSRGISTAASMQASAAATRAAGCLLLGLPCSMRQWSGLRLMSVLAGAHILYGGRPAVFLPAKLAVNQATRLCMQSTTR
jgi:hypothetical protein